MIMLDNYSLFILSPDSDYERTSYNPREFQSRFSTSENIEGFGFGGDFEGFGKDDLFLDHPDIHNSDRTSNDYEDGKFKYSPSLSLSYFSVQIMMAPRIMWSPVTSLSMTDRISISRTFLGQIPGQQSPSDSEIFFPLVLLIFC